MVLEVGQVLDLSLGGDEGLVAQPLAPASPDLGSHSPVCFFVEVLGFGIDDDQVEGPSILVPSGLSLLDGRSAFFDGPGLFGGRAVGLAQDGGDAVCPGPHEDGGDELPGGGLQGPHTPLLDAGHTSVKRRHGLGERLRRGQQGIVDRLASLALGEVDGH